MHTKVVFQAAKAFCRLGCAVLRFNFRGVGLSEGAFDEGVGEMADYRAAIGFMAGRYPGAPLWAAGLSFGAWVAMTVGAADPRVTALIGIASPVTRFDFAAAARSPTHKFFIHGEYDEFCPRRSIREFYGHAAEPKDLVVIDGADHMFDGHVTEVTDAIENLLAPDWAPGADARME
jgi:hypothetical protein